MGVLDSKHLTNRQYDAYLDESWTFGTSPEHALTGMFMVVEATTATNCGLRAEDSMGIEVADVSNCCSHWQHQASTLHPYAAGTSEGWQQDITHRQS